MEFLFYYGSAKLIWQNSTFQPKYQSQTGFVDHIREKTLLGACVALPKKCEIHTWCWILNEYKPLSPVFLTPRTPKHGGMLLFLILIRIKNIKWDINEKCLGKHHGAYSNTWLCDGFLNGHNVFPSWGSLHILTASLYSCIGPCAWCVCALLHLLIYGHTQNWDSFRHFGMAEARSNLPRTHWWFYFKKREEEKPTSVSMWMMFEKCLLEQLQYKVELDFSTQETEEAPLAKQEK